MVAVAHEVTDRNDGLGMRGDMIPYGRFCRVWVQISPTKFVGLCFDEATWCFQKDYQLVVQSFLHGLLSISYHQKKGLFPKFRRVTG